MICVHDVQTQPFEGLAATSHIPRKGEAEHSVRQAEWDVRLRTLALVPPKTDHMAAKYSPNHPSGPWQHYLGDDYGREKNSCLKKQIFVRFGHGFLTPAWTFF